MQTSKFSSDKDTKQNGGLLINPNANSTRWELDEIAEVDQNLVFYVRKPDEGWRCKSSY